MVALTLISPQNIWTGTRGSQPRLTIVHAPDVVMQKKIAHAAIDFVIEHFGAEEMQNLTLAQAIQCLVELS